MVSVKVISKTTGNAMKSQKVSIGFSGFFRGFSETVYSDGNGEANFNNDPGEGTIYVNGNAVYRGLISGMKYVYI